MLFILTTQNIYFINTHTQFVIKQTHYGNMRVIFVNITFAKKIYFKK